MSRRSALVSAYAGLQVLGYLALAAPGRPGYDELEPAVWVVMDLLIFVTLALAAGLPFSTWVARGSAGALVVALAITAQRNQLSPGYAVMISSAAAMAVVALLIKPRAQR